MYNVVTCATANEVIPPATIDGVIPTQPDDNVPAGSALEHIIPVTASDGGRFTGAMRQD
jgi:hypothetical protein